MSSTETTDRSKQAWRAAGLHNVYLPSGFNVELRFPSLVELMRNNSVPDHLRAVALEEIGRESGLPAYLKIALGLDATPAKTPDENEVAQTYELGEWLITQMLVDPVLTLADLRDDQVVPSEDRDFLFLLAARYRSRDARGRSIGVTALAELEPFPEEHGCAPDCQACARSFAAVSTNRGVGL